MWQVLNLFERREHTIKKIENGFADYYYLDENGVVYNANTKKYLKGDSSKNSYKLRTIDGSLKSITIKKLYKLVYNKVFCIDIIKNQKDEVYKEVEGTDGNYYISNYGNLKSYNNYESILIKPADNKGYYRVHINQYGEMRNVYIHRLVAMAFLEPPKNIDYELHHKDRDTHNNNVNNLEWLSPLEHKEKHK